MDLRKDLSYGASWSPWPIRPINKVKWSPVQTIVVDPVGHHGQDDPFTMSNDPRSSYGASWSPRPKWPIYKVKRTSEQLWSQLITTVKTAHIKGQKIPRARKPLILLILVCYNPRDFMVTLYSNVIFAKNLHGPPLRP
ncbi:hypothetical protein H5410_029305 [Solanum commersonii]|uniref:Uncharacterized protein n=1 Tax=Solanum commersonii TaxID=4109 RepID=A0A9J5Z6F1_SOLCO|nr:hypothetical protein H5410_029305 [Solanum commersonii]